MYQFVYIVMMVADVLAPSRYQAMNNLQVDLSMLYFHKDNIMQNTHYNHQIKDNQERQGGKQPTGFLVFGDFILFHW